MSSFCGPPINAGRPLSDEFVHGSGCGKIGGENGNQRKELLLSCQRSCGLWKLQFFECLGKQDILGYALFVLQSLNHLYEDIPQESVRQSVMSFNHRFEEREHIQCHV